MKKSKLTNPVSATKKAVSNCLSVTYGFVVGSSQDKNRTNRLDDLGRNSEDSPKKKMQKSQNTLYVSIKTYTPPRLTMGKSNYISFYSYDPEEGKLKRKKIHLNNIRGKKALKDYADEMIKRLNAELRAGWNPWLQGKTEKNYKTLEEVTDAYRRDLLKKLKERYLKEKTVKGYNSMLKILLDFNGKRERSITYIYQLTAEFCSAFIDYIWLDQNNTGTTRDNYVGWLKTFTSFLLSKQFVEIDPAIHITRLGKRKKIKSRTVISKDHMAELKNYCEKNNKHYLLACYILYYCLIRPKEMSYIQLEHISVKRGTIFIPDYSSKNNKDGTVTIPDKVLKLMIELDVFNNPSSYYLFGEKCKPNAERWSEKQFRDIWSYKVRKELKFPDSYKFYSLKDTGITDLIKANMDLLSVRDQARHHSLMMTDIYTPHDIEAANDLIKLHSSDF